MRYTLTVIALAISLGCSKTGSHGDRVKVTLYSPSGQQVGKWTCTKIIDRQGDSYVFVDSETDKLMSVSGTVVIEVVKSPTDKRK